MKNLYAKVTQRNDRGFTLIELLVVIAIIAVLAALVLAALSSAQKGSRDSRRKSDLNTYKTALAQFNSDTNSYPASGNVAPGASSGGPCAVGTNYLTKCLAPPAQGNFSYIYLNGGADTYCISTKLERDTSTGHEVTPTFSGKPADAPTAGTPDGSNCAAST